MYTFHQFYVSTHSKILVGGFNPSEKYARQIGNLPQIEVTIQNI